MLMERWKSHRATKAPETLNGSAIRTDSGSIKLLNCDASTIYATTTPRSSTQTRLCSDSAKVCELPVRVT